MRFKYLEGQLEGSSNVWTNTTSKYNQGGGVFTVLEMAYLIAIIIVNTIIIDFLVDGWTIQDF